MGKQVSRRGVLNQIGSGAVDASAQSMTWEDRHIVGIEPGLASQDVDAFAGMAAELDRRIDLEHLGVVLTGRFPEAARNQLQRDSRVRYVEEDGRVDKLSQTLPWGVDRVDADSLTAEGRTGDGATVAVLDTGVDEDHPDIPTPVQGKCFSSDCCGESCSTDNTCNYLWSDDNDHGTHVSGIVAALDDTGDVVGVGPGIDIMAGKVLNGCGSGSLSAVADGIRWAADNGADVINMSLGGSSGNTALKDACQYAVSNNVVVVAAAGNDGPCSDCVGYPARYSTVIAVSSTDSDDSLSGFSSTGPEVELAAPGGSVLSTVPSESSTDGTATFSGTSMASPHVAGAAALVVAETSLSDTDSVRSRLGNTAEDLGLGDNGQGNGLLDVKDGIPLVGGWTFDVGSRIQFASVAADGSRAYVGSLDRTLYALTVADGTVEWSFDRAGALADSSPALTNGRVYVGSGAGTVYALDASSGTADWTHTTGSAIVSSPTVASGVVYVGTNDGRVLALDDGNGGTELWSASVGEAVYSAPVVSSGTVYVTTREGQVVALDTSTESETWRTDLGSPVGHGSPAVGNGQVYVAADAVYALKDSDGTTAWSTSYGGTAESSPVYDSTNTQVIVGSADGSVYALQDSDGSENWSSATGDAVGSSPTLVDGWVAVGSDDGTLYLFDASTGDELAGRSLGKLRSSPAVERDVAFVGTWDGTVVALENVG